MCYTFNGEGVSKTWRPSEVMETFDQIFPHETIEKEWFGGSGAVQGKDNCCLQVMFLVHIYKLYCDV